MREPGIPTLSVIALFLLAFILDPIVMEGVSDLPTGVVDAAELFTHVGNSAWLGILLPAIMLVAAYTEISTKSPTLRSRATLILRLAIVLFLLVLLSGIAVQLLKHSFGRARPDLFAELGAFEFRPYALSFAFNSFPSGHATTLGALALFLCWLWPQHRAAILVAALCLAVTRIVVGKHYPSDVLAGLLLGFGTTYVIGKLLLRAGLIPDRTDPVFDRLGHFTLARAIRFLKRCSWTAWTADRLYVSLLIGTLIVLNLGMITFLAAPQIDLQVSRVFFDETDGFWIAQDQRFVAMRYAFLWTTQLIGLTAIFAYLLWWRLRPLLEIPKAVVTYVLASFVIGPGVLVNEVLKSHWGRARPADVIEFGGDKLFTFPFERADQCLSNCSFVSGEGSGIAMATIVGATLLWPWIKRQPRIYWALGLGIALFGIGLRVAMGRHFFSDSLFAVLLMAVIALILYRWCAVGRHRERLSPTAMRHDLHVLRNYVIGPLRIDQPTLLRDVLNLLRALLRIVISAGEVLKAIGLGGFDALRSATRVTVPLNRVTPGE